MKFYILFVVLVVIGTSTSVFLDPIAEDSSYNRIVNGTTARPGQFPYIVSTRIQRRVNGTLAWRHNCGGSIISRRWILSAAHCFSRPVPSKFRVVVGAHHLFNDGITHTLNRIIKHPQFNPSTLLNDVSLLLTTKPIVLNNRVRIIPLRSSFVEDGVASVISGWGLSFNPKWPTHPSPNHLQYLSQETLANDQCRNLHLQQNWRLITKTTICAFAETYRGIHVGDYGSPLVANGKQIGIAAWAVWPRARGRPEGYTRISSSIDWIQGITGIIAA